MRKRNWIVASGLFAGIVSFAPSAAHGVALGWNFGDDNATVDTGTPVNFSASDIIIANSLGTVSDPVNSTSASSGYTGASGTGNIGNAVAANVTSVNTSTTAYYSVTFTPTSGNSIQLSDFDFGARGTATGPQAYSLRTSVNNFATDVATGTLLADSTWRFIDTSFSTVNGAVNTPVEVRLYTYNGTGSPGSNTQNHRLDDITINVAAVPEPGMLGGVALAAGGLILRRRRSVIA